MKREKNVFFKKIKNDYLLFHKFTIILDLLNKNFNKFLFMLINWDWTK